jgi:hypothetical protein
MAIHLLRFRRTIVYICRSSKFRLQSLLFANTPDKVHRSCPLSNPSALAGANDYAVGWTAPANPSFHPPD